MTTDLGYKPEFDRLSELATDIADDLSVCSALHRTAVSDGLRFNAFMQLRESLLELTAGVNAIAERADGSGRTLRAWEAGE